MTLGIPAFLVMLAVYLLKPHIAAKHLNHNSPLSRKRIAGIGAASLLVATIGFGSVLAATEPASVKADRVVREATEAKLLQAQQESQKKQEAEKLRKQNAEAARKKEEELNKPVVKTEIKLEVIPFESTEQNDGSIPAGEKRVSTAGVVGERTVTYNVRYTKGKETARTETKNEITKAPVTQVTLNGTYVKPAPAPAPPAQSSGSVKMSRTGICHAPGTTYYDQTTHFTPYNSTDACLASGGRLPKR